MSKYDIVPPLQQQETEQSEPIDESLVVKYPKERNVIDDTDAEMQVLKNAFKSPMDLEREKKEQNTNPNFWFAVYFQNENQKNNFLKNIGADSLTEGLYIDGIEFAKHLGIDIEKEEMKIPGKFKSFKQ